MPIASRRVVAQPAGSAQTKPKNQLQMNLADKFVTRPRWAPRHRTVPYTTCGAVCALAAVQREDTPMGVNAVPTYTRASRNYCVCLAEITTIVPQTRQDIAHTHSATSAVRRIKINMSLKCIAVGHTSDGEVR